MRTVLCGACLLALAGGGGAAALWHRPDRAGAAAAPSLATAPVTRTDLVSRTQADGTLGYAHTYTVTGGTGRITWLPAVGDAIRRGQRVYGVNGHAVPLFYGSTPLWRVLRPGVDDGADVKELETNLKALGYGADITVDDTYTSATADAVRKWQSDLGVTQTGTVAPDDVVMEPGEVRVSDVRGTVGGPAAGPVLAATDTSRQVTVDLPVSEQELAVVGSAVRIALPGGRSATGKVSSIGTTASAGQDASSGKAQTGQGTQTATIPVYVTMDDPAAAGTLDGAPVTVGFTSAAHANVLAVPVNALLAEADGTYAVEVVDGTRRTMVPVKLGIFADGRVEVSGTGLAAGMRVGVPNS